ncbi:SH3 domain-containing protein [Gottfriedia sp. OAE603]|uniref:SH3 domain-containing protein n=1 Tax=Gottfriedia sp. OAE603 TaxID=2663872 RepID=UPI0017899070
MKHKLLKAFVSTVALTSAITFSGSGVITSQKVSAAVIDAPISVYEVTASKLNVRSAPSTNSKIVDSLRKNDQIEIVKYTNSNWAQIKTTTTKSGVAYVSTKYLAKVQSIIKTKANLNLRTGPSTKYKVLTVIPKGANVSFLGYAKSKTTVNTGWAIVTYKGYKGYASTAYLDMK